ncbi:MAG TPA: nitroreductase/quinone reductase family protein [Phototrophicaceae bacterium]|nr:nitroreductase/quinone reductase family protein [Phototrophicaceae bacterium]
MAATDQPQFLYLTTTGRKSGKPHQIEIWFVERAGHYYLMHEGDTLGDWEKNIAADPHVIIHIGSREAPPIEVTGRAVDPAAEPDLVAAVKALMDAKYQWSNGSITELTPNIR